MRHHRPEAGGQPDLPGRSHRQDDFGGSALFRMFGGKGGVVPDVDTALLRGSSDGLNECMADGMVKACHDLSDGGLAVAMAEMCIGGDVGAELDLSEMGG